MEEDSDDQLFTSRDLLSQGYNQRNRYSSWAWSSDMSMAVFWCYPMQWGLVIWRYIALVAINTKFPGRSSLGKNVFLSCLDFWASQQLWSCSPSSWSSPTSSSSWSAATMTTTTLPTSFPNAQVLTQVNCGHHQILGARLTLKYFDNLWRWSSHQTVH